MTAAVHKEEQKGGEKIMFQVTAELKVKNAGKLQAAIDKTQKALDELKASMWELSNLGVVVEVEENRQQ